MSLTLTIWSCLLVYNVMSALFGIDKLRRVYVDLLRKLYRLMGSKMRSSHTVTEEKALEGEQEAGGMARCRSFGTFRHEFQLEDAASFIQEGMQVIVDDGVTKSFSTQEVEEWNFLTRTQMQVNLGLKWEILLWLSILFRFAILIVIRLPIGVTSLMWLIGTMCLLPVLKALFPKARWRQRVEGYCAVVFCRLIGASLSAVINIHNKENRAKSGSVCVANHTSPIDIVMLAGDNCFTMVGQRHRGFTGMIQMACSMAQSTHIWFERKVAEDRQMVSKRLKEHIQEKTNNPILIFPEGTCINNTSVFMFKKGCFELGATIYPVVIKYRREFADPFWNSQEQNMLTYLFMLMTSWAIVCDVYYLKPTTIQPQETGIEFAQRVKADICSKGGLVDLPWDGMIKRPGHESYLQKVMAEERKAYSEVLEIGHQSSQTASEVEDQSD